MGPFVEAKVRNACNRCYPNCMRRGWLCWDTHGWVHMFTFHNVLMRLFCALAFAHADFGVPQRPWLLARRLHEWQRLGLRSLHSMCAW